MRAEESVKYQRLGIDERITSSASRYRGFHLLSDPRLALLSLHVPPFRRAEQVPFLRLGLPHATRNQRIWDTSGLKAQTHLMLGKD